jgi:hypothetical protein
MTRNAMRVGGAPQSPAEAPSQPPSAIGCCGSTDRTAVREQSAPTCCGTVAQAEAEGSCCGTAAKQKAVASGAGCCG